MNTNIDLARVTTKSKSKTQAVSNDVSVEGEGDGGFEERPNIGDSSSEQDRGKAILKAIFNGEETY